MALKCPVSRAGSRRSSSAKAGDREHAFFNHLAAIKRVDSDTVTARSRLGTAAFFSALTKPDAALVHALARRVAI